MEIYVEKLQHIVYEQK